MNFDRMIEKKKSMPERIEEMVMEKKEKWKLMQAQENGEQLDSKILDSITKNPLIRELPDLAAMYGLYSRFVVCNDSVYFACGINQEVVHGSFIYARDTVIPEYLVKKYGYFKREDVHCGLLNLQCAVLSLDDRSSLFHGQITGMKPSASLFATMETYCRLYRKHGMNIPEFIFSDRHALDELQTCLLAQTNTKLLSNAEKQSYWTREEALLKDHAIWHWPISKVEDAGFCAFSVCSRYALDTSNLTKALRHYRHPKKWEKLFQNGKLDSPLFHETHDEPQMAFLMAGLTSMGIPYKAVVYSQRCLKNKQQEKLDLGQRLVHKKNLTETQTIALHKYDMGALAFLLTEYLKSQFSKKEHEIERKLYYGLGHTNDTEKAAYMFFIDSAFLGDFRDFAAKNHILWGFPADSMEGFEADKGCFLIAEAESMPLIQDFLYKKIYKEFSTHAISTIGQPGCEVRTYDSNRISAWVMTPGITKIGEKGQQAIFHNLPWCVPLQELKKKGFWVENR